MGCEPPDLGLNMWAVTSGDTFSVVSMNAPRLSAIDATRTPMKSTTYYPATGCAGIGATSIPASESEHHRIRLEAEQDAADRFVMRLPPLRLLQYRMHIPEPAFKRTIVEDRRRPGAVIEAVDD